MTQRQPPARNARCSCDACAPLWRWRRTSGAEATERSGAKCNSASQIASRPQRSAASGPGRRIERMLRRQTVLGCAETRERHRIRMPWLTPARRGFSTAGYPPSCEERSDEAIQTTETHHEPSGLLRGAVIGPATSGRTRWLAMTSDGLLPPLAPRRRDPGARWRGLLSPRRGLLWRCRFFGRPQAAGGVLDLAAGQLPAFPVEVEDDAVGVLELALEPVVLGLAEIVEELGAGRSTCSAAPAGRRTGSRNGGCRPTPWARREPTSLLYCSSARLTSPSLM